MDANATAPEPTRTGSVRCLDPHGFHRLHWVEWGDRDNPRVLVCAHGLTRCGRDFDFLASRLADAYRVVCPDIAGRGVSDRLADPADYGYPVYCADMATLLAALGAESVDWVGTSMGGLLGMLLAAVPRTPVGKLVMNDVGSVIPKAALERIATYVGRDPAFESLEALEAAMRAVSPFGALDAAQWRHLAAHTAICDDAGRWRFRYDPGIAQPFRAGALADVDLRAAWRAVPGPVLVIRGAQSDLLTPEILAGMLERPGTESLVVEGAGHAPMLMDDAQVAAVRAFLLA
ncbi:MAG: alpha/beta hydrolase [Betaproteobacteria bacterium]|nr:alpha/beta hydrolase [Betaproteobacteria bacterium]